MPRVAASLLLAALATLCACAGGPSSRRAPAAPYRAEDAGLFGDRMAAAVLGGSAAAIEGRSSDEDIRRRSERADGVSRVTIRTITSERNRDDVPPHFTLTVTPAGPPLRGEALPGSLDLRIRPGTPAYSQVRAQEAALVGRRLILFYRRFTDGVEETVHWHAEADTPEVAAAIGAR